MFAPRSFFRSSLMYMGESLVQTLSIRQGWQRLRFILTKSPEFMSQTVFQDGLTFTVRVRCLPFKLSTVTYSTKVGSCRDKRYSFLLKQHYFRSDVSDDGKKLFTDVIYSLLYHFHPSLLFDSEVRNCLVTVVKRCIAPVPG